MKKEEMNYEKWLEQLKKTPPVLENPDALTEDIMRTVKAAPFRNLSLIHISEPTRPY